MIYASFDAGISATPETMQFKGNFSDLRNLISLGFEAADTGKMVYLTARYSNAAGPGPFGVVFQGVVT
ncbi:hypothetical protein B1R32_1434 [Abditibacterium utsteinense]|uniref:Uncharacterized protein n=1 Tax=Abditibacterium utsteinense TaxID=1960156 RepID=A0A2S8SNI0_9BACT|nr:hypothetical protein [Abditibacterium utsteinense]PQV62385.1 hypothetical protein B1R32_1434 [Abditibacterium utsteinense]